MTSVSLVPYMNNDDDRNNTTSRNTSSSTNVVVFDALPYIDTIHPDYEQHARSLIEQELQEIIAVAEHSGTNGNDEGKKTREQQQQQHQQQLHPRVTRFERATQRPPTEAFRIGYQNIIDGERLNLSHHQPPKLQQQQQQQPLAQSEFPLPPTQDTVEEWYDAVKKSRIRYETERMRSTQLEVEKDNTASSDDAASVVATRTISTDNSASASSVWKRYNQHVLEPILLQHQQRLEQRQYQVSTINHQRQQKQVQDDSQTLSSLQYQYNDLLQKQYGLKVAVSNMRNDLLHRQSEK
jgi:Breast carcinoma amplified sequence 2 (BCAS2)